MKTTYKNLIEIDTVVAGLYTKDPTLQDTKFGYAYSKFFKKNTEKIITDKNTEIKDAIVDNALEDEKTKALILDEKSPTGYAHTKEQTKSFFKKQKEITDRYNNMEVEVEPYISSYIPEMSEQQKEILTGFII